MSNLAVFPLSQSSRALEQPTTSRAYRLLLACLFALHLALVVAMVWWAFILALPIPTFATSTSYWWFQHHWPFTEDGWAGLFLLAAVLGLPGFLPLKRRTLGVDNAWPRIIATTLLACAHGSIAWATIISNPGSTGPGIYTIMAGLALFRVAVEAKL